VVAHRVPPLCLDAVSRAGICPQSPECAGLAQLRC
jgi:hypothetical protein